MSDGWESTGPYGYDFVKGIQYVCQQCGCVVPYDYTRLHTEIHRKVL